MQNQHKFTARTRMSDLINEDASLLSSISRFGISLGFGDKTVREACEANNIDCDTFLSVVNFLSEGNVEINYGKNKYKLNPGDSIYYDSIVPHHVHAGCCDTAKILAVVYTPV